MGKYKRNQPLECYLFYNRHAAIALVFSAFFFFFLISCFLYYSFFLPEIQRHFMMPTKAVLVTGALQCIINHS